MNENNDQTMIWQELYKKYQKHMEQFNEVSEEKKKALIMSSIIYDIQAMQRIIKTLDPNAENPINIPAINPEDDQYLEKLYVLILQLQYTFADMNNRLFGVLTEDNEVIDKLSQAQHK